MTITFRTLRQEIKDEIHGRYVYEGLNLYNQLIDLLNDTLPDIGEEILSYEEENFIRSAYQPKYSHIDPDDNCKIYTFVKKSDAAILADAIRQMDDDKEMLNLFGYHTNPKIVIAVIESVKDEKNLVNYYRTRNPHRDYNVRLALAKRLSKFENLLSVYPDEYSDELNNFILEKFKTSFSEQSKPYFMEDDRYESFDHYRAAHNCEPFDHYKAFHDYNLLDF